MSPRAPELTSIRFGRFELDFKNEELRKSGVQVKLAQQPFHILRLIATRPNELVTRQEIYQKVWPEHKSGVESLDQRLDFHLKTIRDALGDTASNPRYVETVRGRGYRFIGVAEGSALPNGAASVQPPEPEGVTRGTEGKFQPGTFIWTWQKAGWLVFGVLVLFTCAVGFYHYKVKNLGEVSSAKFSGNALQALSATGRVLWAYDFGQPLRADLPREEYEARVHTPELGGSGPDDILAIPPLLVPGDPKVTSDALYSFTEGGKLKWRHDFADIAKFGGKNYGPPWQFAALMVGSVGRDRSIWCAVENYYWTPSILVDLDLSGHEKGRFVNWGHIKCLNSVRNASGSFILAGGIDNECDCAMLAVLRADQPSGSSPPIPGSTLKCNNCPAGEPYRYFLFPRSELTQLSGSTYTKVKVIQYKEGHLAAYVEDTSNEAITLGADWEEYSLSDDLVPQSVTASDHFLTLHRQMEAEGKIKHSVERCPELTRPRIVQEWEPGVGWKQTAVPHVKLE